MEPLSVDQIVPELTLDAEEDSLNENEEMLNENEEMSSEERLLKYICRQILPTGSLFAKMSASAWKQMISNMLPLIGKISVELEDVHKVRFCSDLANVLVIPFDLPSETLITFGTFLQHTDLESNDIFNLLMEKIHVFSSEYEVCSTQLQKIICLYIQRCLACNPDSDTVMENILLYIAEQNLIDPKLSFLGPILRQLLEMELVEDKEDMLRNILVNGVSDNILFSNIDHCLHQIKEKDKADSVFPTLLVDVMEELFSEELSVKEMSDIESNTDEIVKLTFVADKILQSECFSLQQLVAVGFLRTYLKTFAILLGENLDECETYAVLCNNVNPLLKPGADSELEISRSKGILHYTLKCISEGDRNLRKVCQSLTGMIPNLETLDWNHEFLLLSLEYSPFATHCPHRYNDYISVLLEDQDDEQLLKMITDGLTSNEHMMSFMGAVLNRFVLKKSLQELSDGEKTLAQRVLEMARKDLTSEQLKILEYAAGKLGFGHEMYNLTVEEAEKETYVVSILLHLLCILTAYDCRGNLWFEILTKPDNEDVTALLGDMGTKPKKKPFAFSCVCSHRYLSETSMCPVCSQNLTIKTEMVVMKSEVTEETLPLFKHILQFFVSCCLMNSLAFNYINEERLQSVLCHEDKDNVSDELCKRLFHHWDRLRDMLILNNKDLCGLLNCALTMCTPILADPSYSKNNADFDLQSFVRQLVISFDKLLQDRFNVLQENRSIIYQAAYVPQDALECQLDEIITIEDPQQRFLHLPSLFRSTSSPTMENLCAELSVDAKYSSYPFLHLVLQNLELLPVTRFITPLLKWHLATVTFGSYLMRKVECREIVIGKFITKGDDKTKQILRKQFKQFEDAWNRLKGEFSTMLKKVNPSLKELELVSTGSKVDRCIILDSDSPLHQVLCTLVQVQNMFLDEALNVAVQRECPSINFINADDQSARIPIIQLMDIDSKDVITYEWNDEVLQYSQCETELGHGKMIQYDFLKIEMELAHDIVLGKSHIAIPKAFTQIVFTDELFKNSVSLLQELKVSIRQEPLTSEIIKGIERKKETDTTESLTLLGMVLTILKKTGGESDVPLVEFIEKWKDVIAQSSCKKLLPEPEHCVKLGHIVALYEWFEELNGENIYESLDDFFRIPLPPDARTKIEETAAKHIKLIERLARALKLFVHRCLSSKDNDIDRERPLIDYIRDPTFWQDDVVDGEYKVDGSHPKIKLVDVISKTTMVENIYDAITFVQQKIEEHKEKDKRISSIAAVYQASKPEMKTKAKKARVARKGGGKT